MTRLLLVAAVLVAVLAAAGVGAGAEWHVNPGAGTPIQDAIDGAGAGDAIYVHAGTYVENVAVGKRLTLIGDGADVVMVRAEDATDHVFEVIADWVNILGFTVTGATSGFKVGIYLYNANHCNISNNNVLNNDYGIRLLSSNSNMLQNNNASNNNYGICLDISSDNTLKGNTMFGNTHNFGVNGGLYGYTHNIDTSNTVDGKPIYYWVDQHDRQISADAGFVGVVNSKNITVKDLTLTKNYIGVLFACTENSRIENVTTSNNGYGIGLCHSDNNTLTNNTANSNRWSGIFLDDSSNNTLQSNTMSGNTYNFDIWGGRLSDYIQNIDTSNTVDGKPIYYWVDQQDKQIICDAGFIGVVNSNNITVKNLTLTNNTQGVLFACTENSRIENVTTSNNAYGIYLWYSSNNTLQNNTASNNAYGIVLSDSSNNTLTSNTANSNFWIGIRLVYSSNNTLQNNTVSNNRNGIHLYSLSNNNTIYHNNHINNTSSNAYDTDTNQWDSGSEGNYYSDYIGTDPDGDGIGEDPHPILGGTSIDHFPLMHPWTATPQKGDLNSDHLLTPADAAIALRIAVIGVHDDAADVSGGGQVTSLDALMILQAAAGNVEL